MLEELLRYVNNRFDADMNGRAYGSTSGTIKIVGGVLNAKGLKEGQYFWVEGSTLNDGLHLHPADDLIDEEFKGRVVYLRVPRAVVELADEIYDWTEKNSDMLNSPLQSESFGGYSYTKASMSGKSGGGYSWQDHFSSRFRPFVKLSRDWM